MDEVVTRFILDNQADTAASRILIIDSPPRHGKSEYISKHVSAWFMGRYPDQNVILTSYESAFAASWGRKARDVLAHNVPPGFLGEGEPVSNLFGVSIDPNLRAASEWGLEGHRGTMRTAGAGGPITGKGANLLIIDDPVKNEEAASSPVIRDNLQQWLDSTILTRLEPNGCLIVMATRWHREDPSGYLLSRAKTVDGEPVLHIHMPAIAEDNDWLGREPGEPLWPERWPLAKLERARRGRSNYWWQAMYQGRPTAHTGTEWPDSYFGSHIWVQEKDWPESFDLRILCVDPSKGRRDKPGDFCAIVFVGVRHGLLYVDAQISRIPMLQITTDTLTWAAKYRPHYVGIESNAFQELLLLHFQEQSRLTFGLDYPVYKINHALPKDFRIRRLDPYLANREIRFRASSVGARLLVEQLRDFPLAEHDDGPDALEMCVRLPLDIDTIHN